MRSLRFAPLLALASLGGLLAPITVGCGSSHTDPPDSGPPPITFDASLPMDSGMNRPSNVGQGCSMDSDCGDEALFCQFDPGLFPDGYCTALCGTDADCPEGSACLAISDTAALCFLSCDPSAAASTCFAGQGCSSILGPPICLDGCSRDEDCAEIPGTACYPGSGFLGAGSCLADDLGGACTDDAQCTGEAFCVTETSGYPGGACASYGCDATAGAGCPAGAECVALNAFQSYCFDACATDGDCRAGYGCRDASGMPGAGTCQPACADDSVCSGGRTCHTGSGGCIDAGQLGGACSFRTGGCDGGACLSERTSGFPGNYCAFTGCDPADSSTCPAGGVCATRAEGNFCLDGCADTSECRPGYACLPTVADDPSSPTACLPACMDDSVCDTDRGRTCDLATGLCR